MFQTRSVRSVTRLSHNQQCFLRSVFLSKFSTLHSPSRFGNPGIAECSSNELRQSFLNFFKSKGHNVLPSSSSVPGNDPTLLFTSAGMVPFKNIFLGLEPAAHGSTVSTSQRCVRAGGKHNDLDNVGFTSRHHTYFEMLGNFSFGDYFKEDAMRYAWEYLTEVLKLPKERLKISVFREDNESAMLWEQISGFTEASGQIFRMDEADNFWQMGDTGPCGPCSEIYWDQMEEVDGERFLEIWNLVFMQYNRDAAGVLHPLATKCVDTGMGLERLSAVMQGVRNNFDTDTLLRLVNAVLTRVDDSKTSLSTEEKLTAARVIADHVRAVSVLVADGVVPGNSGRGYVLRRIIRRACRYSHLLGFEQPLLHTLVGLAADISLIHADATIADKVSGIEGLLKQEEEAFLISMTKGLRIISDQVGKTDNGVFPPDVAFQLYDSMGFPFDLTELIVKEQGLSIDMNAVQALMTERRKQSANTWVGSTADAQVTSQVFGSIKKENITSTFVGYNTLEMDTTLTYAYVDNGSAFLVLDQCPFYATGGGQMGDEGTITVAGIPVVINTTIKVPDTNIHVLVASLPDYEPVEKYQALLQPGVSVHAKVNLKVRAQSQAHHSATHLLHHALLQELQVEGSAPVRQAGSLVHDKLLRFDFTYGKPLTPEQIKAVEARVNQAARLGAQTNICEMTLEQSKAAGAVGLFGEKYSAGSVRVVELGESKELCGGTHVTNTNECFPFVIISETGVSSGTRRIEALAGAAAVEYLLDCKTNMNFISGQLKISSLSSPAEVSKNVVRANQRIDALTKKVKELEMLQREQLALSMAASSGEHICPGGCAVDAIDIDNTRVFVYSVPASISDNYAVFRSLAEETAVKQAEASPLPHSVQAFLGASGKAVVFRVSKGEPFDSKKKGKANDAIEVHATSIWKALEQGFPGSKGGGNDVVAQGSMAVSATATPDDIVRSSLSFIKKQFLK